MTFCGRRKKSTVRDFSTPILRKSAKKWFIGIYRKTAPTKSTVLGGDPPPRAKTWKLSKIMDFYRFWAFNTAGKTVTKVGIYALPPLGRTPKVAKSEIYRKLVIFLIYRDPILSHNRFYKIYYSTKFKRVIHSR
jgi:hypothetical protein